MKTSSCSASWQKILVESIFLQTNKKSKPTHTQNPTNKKYTWLSIFCILLCLTSKCWVYQQICIYIQTLHHQECYQKLSSPNTTALKPPICPITCYRNPKVKAWIERVKHLLSLISWSSQHQLWQNWKQFGITAQRVKNLNSLKSATEISVWEPTRT